MNWYFIVLEAQWKIKAILMIVLLEVYTDQRITLILVWIIVSPCKIVTVISLDQDLEMTHT